MDCETDDKFCFVNIGDDFEAKALALFEFQYNNNSVYRQWCQLLGKDVSQVKCLIDIPFMPISFFKTHNVATTVFDPEIVFESSGTTQTVNSKHKVKSVKIYRDSFNAAFQQYYGDAKEWCVIGLLPSYLERTGSSLIMMVDELIKQSKYAESGFYLYDFEKLFQTLQYNEQHKIPTILIGVTFALLDFAEAYKMPLQHTIVMETGGMKGRRAEMTRHEVHGLLKQSFSLNTVHSEYGMTELLSQGYSKGEGLFTCPNWMKVLVRDEEDPLNVSLHGKGVINVIDQANIYSCSFIATDDVGIVHADGGFEIQGRLDNSDIRGCSLLVVN